MTIDELIAKLEGLRGGHDQTVRTEAIALIYGRQKQGGLTPTARFLEEMIRQAKEAKRVALIAAWEADL
jgi:hypothetical protein